jgi:hypothetical protein
MVERFNRRLGEHLGRMPQNRVAHHRRFLDHAERDTYLHTFVTDYNRTRLRCLDYQAPAELLAKLAGHTCAGDDARPAWRIRALELYRRLSASRSLFQPAGQGVC